MRERHGNRDDAVGAGEASRWQRACALFEASLDLDDVAFAAELARVRADDPALAADLERLRAADSADGPFDRGVAVLSPTMADALCSDEPTATAPALEPGVQFGPFRPLALLGRGGMGDVQERRILAQLQHPGMALAEFHAMGREGDNEVGQALESRARALAALGRGADAVATQKQALAIHERAYGKDHRETKRVRERLATLEAGGQALRR